MNLVEMYSALDQIPERDIELSEEQRHVIEHGTGPLWIIAGPGSGKTEVLVLRCLKLLCVDSVDPKSIMITTFTEKAATNLEDRLATYKSYLEQFHPGLHVVDLSVLRVGTLHSLCNDIMQEYRYQDYQNNRLLDELEQRLFIYEHSNLAQANSSANSSSEALWEQFQYLISWNPVTGYTWTPQSQYLPSRWTRTNVAVTLFNRIIEDMVDVGELSTAGGVWAELADAYLEYQQILDDHYRCDFAHLQSKFLDFLETERGRRFLEGDGTQERPPLEHIFVDEYQDTNPIQEAIYLRLADKSPHNLAVVGDDDQALYRFRGGTVDGMISFGQRCLNRWNVQPRQIPLMNNYRSHKDIVAWCNEYVTSFREMNVAGARAPNKPSLQPKSNVVGDYPAVAILDGRTNQDLANRFAETVDGLLQNGVVQRPNQCVLLTKSVRETPRNAGLYADALRARGIDVYNPRSRTLLDQEEVAAALGALLEVLDPNSSAQNAVYGDGIQRLATNWRNTYGQIAGDHPELAGYVDNARQRISQFGIDSLITQASSRRENTDIPAMLQEIFYHIINHDPFVTWQDDPERTVRLAILTQVLETYSSVPFPNSSRPTRGYLRTSSVEPGEVSFGWRQNFYYSLIGLLAARGLNDPEAQEVVCPPDRFPIMTVHQSKGLQFPFVFVAGLFEDAAPTGTHKLEDDLSVFRRNPPTNLIPTRDRAKQDVVRFYYVAFSRAQYALILMARKNQVPTNRSKRPAGNGMGGSRKWFLDQNLTRL